MPERYGINVDVLTDLGLTQNQAKVYLSTAKLGPATIAEVAKHSKVRREEIYRLLPDLEKIGLIERLMGKPMRIRTPDIKAAMSTLLQHERTKARRRISELTEKTDMIEDYFSKTGLDVTSQPDVEDDFALLEEKESIRTRLHEMIRNSNSQIDVIYSRQNLVWLMSSQSQLLIEAVSRNVKVRFVSNPATGKDRIPKIISRRFPNASEVQLKYMTETPTNFIIIDRKEALIITSLKHQPSAHNLYTTNVNLVSLIQEVFEVSWNQSSNWKTTEGVMITEIPKTMPDNFGVPRNILFVYLTRKRKQSVISNFISESFLRNNFILYLCPCVESENIVDHLKSQGIDIDAKLDDEAIQIMDPKEFFMHSEGFSIEKSIDSWDDIYFKAEERGFTGMTTIIEMQFFFDNQMEDSILKLEENLSKMVDANMTVMCVYDEKSLLDQNDPLGLFTRIIVQHDKVVTERNP